MPAAIGSSRRRVALRLPFRWKGRVSRTTSNPAVLDSRQPHMHIMYSTIHAPWNFHIMRRIQCMFGREWQLLIHVSIAPSDPVNFSNVQRGLRRHLPLKRRGCFTVCGAVPI